VINIQQRFSKKIVAMIILLNVAFTIAVLYTFLKVGSEPTSLIVAFFAFTTGELWLLSGITKTKVNSGQYYEDNINNDEGDNDEL
jgi:hydrogenase-4 membrane subunit HyfE